MNADTDSSNKDTQLGAFFSFKKMKYCWVKTTNYSL